MNSYWNLLPLLADRDPRLSGIASGMRARQTPPDPQTIWALFLAMAGLILAFWLLARLLERLNQRDTRTSPWGLFFRLGKTHRLRWSELWLLWRLARRQRLRDPARLFLEPERFEPVHLGGWSSARQAKFQALRQRLFVGLEKNETTGSAPREGTSTEAMVIPMFPSPERPALDLPPWNASSPDTPVTPS